MQEKALNGKITESEYQHICESMKCYTEIRNNLLTFTFTAVITFIGFTFASETEIDPIVYLLPYAALIPFTARMSYYRKWNAHMDVFLELYAPEMHKYIELGNKVKITCNKKDKLLDWLVNYELGILAFVLMLLFYYKYPKQVSCFTYTDWIWAVIPSICTLLVFALIKSVYDYDKIRRTYMDEYNSYEKNNLTI